jgi:serine/threonine-protein kinase
MSRETDPVLSGMSGKIADFRLDGYIGQSANAVVYLALDERSGARTSKMALKVLAPELGRDAAFRDQFLHESQAASALDHPNIIPVYAAGDAGGTLYVAMRYVPGGDARSLLNRYGPLPFGMAWSIIAQSAAALDAAHANGMIHRDVKPTNMLLDADGAGPGVPRAPDGSDFNRVYLSDFGMSRRMPSGEAAATGQITGTLDYVAPEQIEGRAVGTRADLYSLGCAAFELLCGAPPFGQDQGLTVMYAQMYAPPPAATGRRHDLPPAVDRVLATALAKNPADRYPTCGLFAEELRSALGLGADGAPSGARARPAMPAGVPHGSAGVAPAPPTRPQQAAAAAAPSPAPTPEGAWPVAAAGVAAGAAGVAAGAAGMAAGAAGMAMGDELAGPENGMTGPENGMTGPENRMTGPGNGMAFGGGMAPAGMAAGGGIPGDDSGTQTWRHDFDDDAMGAQAPVDFGPGWFRDERPGPPGPGMAGPGAPTQGMPGPGATMPGGTMPGAPPHGAPGPGMGGPGPGPANQMGRPIPPFQRRQTGAPKPPRKINMKLAAIGAAIVVIAVAGALGVELTKGSSPSKPPAASPAPSASPAASTTALASRQAASVNTLLGSSLVARRALADAVTSVRGCAHVPLSVSHIQRVVNRRSAEFDQAKTLKLNAIAGGPRIKADLLAALRNSLDADQAYLTWAKQMSARCKPNRKSSAYSAAIAADSQAANSKQVFVRAWNPVAAKYGLPQKTATSI